MRTRLFRTSSAVRFAFAAPAFADRKSASADETHGTNTVGWNAIGSFSPKPPSAVGCHHEAGTAARSSAADFGTPSGIVLARRSTASARFCAVSSAKLWTDRVEDVPNFSASIPVPSLSFVPFPSMRSVWSGLNRRSTWTAFRPDSNSSSALASPPDSHGKPCVGAIVSVMARAALDFPAWLSPVMSVTGRMSMSSFRPFTS